MKDVSWVEVRERSKSPTGRSGMSGLCSHLFGGAGRAVVLVRVGLGLGGGGAVMQAQR